MKAYYKIAILVLSVILLAVGSWFFLLRPNTQSDEPQDLNQILSGLTGNDPNVFVANTGDRSTPAPQPSSQPVAVNLQPLTVEELSRQSLENFAARFVERWGTYSNQTDLSHLRSLEQDMTASMQKFLETYIANIRNERPYQAGYFGLTTKAASVDIENFDPSAAKLTARVGAIREETSDNQDPVVYNQEARVDLVKTGENWQVHGVFWE